jgi:hypothetical protein
MAKAPTVLAMGIRSLNARHEISHTVYDQTVCIGSGLPTVEARQVGSYLRSVVLRMFSAQIGIAESFQAVLCWFKRR